MERIRRKVVLPGRKILKDFWIEYEANSSIGPKWSQAYKSLASFPCIVLCNKNARIKQESLRIFFFFASARSSVQIEGQDDDNCGRPSQWGLVKSYSRS